MNKRRPLNTVNSFRIIWNSRCSSVPLVSRLSVSRGTKYFERVFLFFSVTKPFSRSMRRRRWIPHKDNGHAPWLRPPLQLPPTSGHLWCGSCSARMCSQRSIVFSAVAASPLTDSRSPRRRLSAPLPPRSYRATAAQSWGRGKQADFIWSSFTHSFGLLVRLSSIVWLSVLSIQLKDWRNES